MYIPFGVFSAGAGTTAFTSDYDLISSTILGSDTSLISFDLTGLGSTYKHLQLRYVARSSSGSTPDYIYSRFNGVSSSTYTAHWMYGNGSSVLTNYATNSNLFYAGWDSASSLATGAFGAGILDLVDVFSTTKNKTMRSLSTSVNNIVLMSGAWNATTLVTSMTLQNYSGGNFITGSRFSLYGIKG